MTTIYDIAKASGCSPTTVSRVLNDYPDVSKKTKERILNTIKELDYIPSTSARSLSTKRSYLIGVLFSESLNIGIEHPYFAGVIEGFKKELANNGYDTMFIVNHLGERELSYVQHCKIRGVDGVCFFVDEFDDKLVELINSNISCVTTDLIHEDVPRICSDNEEGAKLAIKHFIKNKHTAIAGVLGPLDACSSYERLVGVKSAMIENDMCFDEALLSIADDFHVKGGYDATKALFNRLDSSDWPTAIFAGSDTIAIGAIRYLKEIGKKVPEEIEVIGFDNIELASLVSPSLSTIAQNRQEIGKLAANTLLDQIEKRKKIEKKTVKKVPVELILRETTRS